MPTVVPEEREHLCRLVQEAREDWQQAEKNFSWAVEPEMIDYAVYQLLAAQSRYHYLLRQAKRAGVVLSWQDVFRFALYGGEKAPGVIR